MTRTMFTDSNDERRLNLSTHGLHGENWKVAAGRKAPGVCVKFVRVKSGRFKTPRPELAEPLQPLWNTLHKQSKELQTAERGCFDELHSYRRQSVHDQEVEE